MKYKFVRDKKNGETRIDYYKVNDKNAFRLDTLKKLLTLEPLILSIDTNLVQSSEKHKDIAQGYEIRLKESNLRYEVIPIPNTKEKKVLGIPMKTSEERAFNILISMQAQDITKDFFDQYLLNSDVLIGIGPKKSFEEICKDLQMGYMTTFFDRDYFEFTLYDSSFICSMRITKQVEAF